MKPPKFRIGRWTWTIRFWPASWLWGISVARDGEYVEVVIFPVPMLQFLGWKNR